MEIYRQWMEKADAEQVSPVESWGKPQASQHRQRQWNGVCIYDWLHVIYYVCVCVCVQACMCLCVLSAVGWWMRKSVYVRGKLNLALVSIHFSADSYHWTCYRSTEAVVGRDILVRGQPHQVHILTLMSFLCVTKELTNSWSRVQNHGCLDMSMHVQSRFFRLYKINILQV